MMSSETYQAPSIPGKDSDHVADELVTRNFPSVSSPRLCSEGFVCQFEGWDYWVSHMVYQVKLLPT